MSWVRLLWGGFKYLVKGLWWLKISSFCDWQGRYHPLPRLMKNSLVPKFSKPIRILDSFAQISPRKALSFESFFCLAVQQTSRISSEFSMVLKIQNKCVNMCQHADMSDRNVKPYIYTYTVTSWRQSNAPILFITAMASWWHAGYVLCSLLCACWALRVSWTNFCFN